MFSGLMAYFSYLLRFSYGHRHHHRYHYHYHYHYYYHYIINTNFNQPDPCIRRLSPLYMRQSKIRCPTETTPK